MAMDEKCFRPLTGINFNVSDYCYFIRQELVSVPSRG